MKTKYKIMYNNGTRGWLDLYEHGCTTRRQMKWFVGMYNISSDRIGTMKVVLI